MKKPKLLYASPFWPIKSGISEYSHNLVTALSSLWDITLLTDDYDISDETMRKYPSVRYKQGKHYTGFDAVLYNFGNQPDYHGYMVSALKNNPGYVIMHDYSLYYLTVGVGEKEDDLFRSIYRNSGVSGIRTVQDALQRNPVGSLLELKELSAVLPLNRDVLMMAKGVFTHSFYTKKLVEREYPHVPVQVINLLCGDLDQWFDGSEKSIAAKLWGIPEDAFVVTAAGFIAPTKQNTLACKAVKQYNMSHHGKIYYLMAGEGNDADGYLDNHCIKTGFVPNEDLAHAIARGDVVFNLRYPTNGETSATLVQAMQAGRICVTTDIGWFGELPDDVVIKVRPDVTPEELVALIERIRIGEFTELGRRAKEYVLREYAPERIAETITDFILK